MKKLYYFPILALIIISSCKITEKQGETFTNQSLKDGEYIGDFKGGINSAKVKIAIKNKEIAQIELIKHDAWKGVKAEDSVINRIIRFQSTNVDAVTGATNSSHVIMNAVQNAVEKAK